MNPNAQYPVFLSQTCLISSLPVDSMTLINICAIAVCCDHLSGHQRQSRFDQPPSFQERVGGGSMPSLMGSLAPMSGSGRMGGQGGGRSDQMPERLMDQRRVENRRPGNNQDDFFEAKRPRRF